MLGNDKSLSASIGPTDTGSRRRYRFTTLSNDLFTSLSFSVVWDNLQYKMRARDNGPKKEYVSMPPLLLSKG
jgi:hypothetical protein